MYKLLQIYAPPPPELQTLKTLRYIAPPDISPRGLYLEIALKFKVKQSKNCSVTHKCLHLPKNFYMSQMIAVKKCHSKLLLA